MDTNTIEILLGFSDFSVIKIESSKLRLDIYGESHLEESICPNCLKKCNKVTSTSERVIRDRNILDKEVYLHLTSRQFHCQDCTRYFQEVFSFVSKNKNQTHRLEKYLYLCLKDSSFKEVATRENLLWDVLDGIFKKYSKREISKHLDYLPKRLGIDEFAYKKGKKDYAVVLVDLDRGQVWDILECRSKEYLRAYFLSKGDIFCKGIEVFSCDMWEGFSNTAKELFPNADVVIDRFHFFQHCNAVLDSIRKELRRKDDKNVHFKQIKWLLYKAWKDLTHKDRRTLLKAFRFSTTLRKVYFMKVELQNIFNTDLSKQEAQKLLEQWIEEAQKINHKAMNKFINTFNSWKNDIINFFKYRCSNGIVEGINNKIKTLKRNAYGFRNFQNFRLRIITKFI
jgi:transposase